MFLAAGRWSVAGEVVWSPVITAQYVLTAYVIGQPIDPQRQSRFLRYFRQAQMADGGWGLHPESRGYVFVTALVYVALRLLGLSADDPLCLQVRLWLRDHGGVESIPSWGKLWLAMMNLYGYEGINPVLPEAWLLPRALPLHPAQLYCHTRLIYLGFSYLYGVRFQLPAGDFIQQPFEAIPFRAFRHRLSPTDVYLPPNRLLRRLADLEGWYERHHRPGLRQRALQRVLEHLLFHHRQTNGVSLSPVNGLLSVLALSHAGYREGEEAFRGLDYWAWQDEGGGERFCGAHSQNWDTSFAVQALCEGPASQTGSCLHGLRRTLERFEAALPAEEQAQAHAAMRKGADWLRKQQQRDGSWPGFWGIHYTYGTLFGITGLLASGAKRNDEATLRACRWLVQARLADGGWGESWHGLLEGRYVPHVRSQVIMTSWALLALLRAEYQGNTRERPLPAGFNCSGNASCRAAIGRRKLWPAFSSTRPCCTIACTRPISRSGRLVCMKIQCGSTRLRMKRERTWDNTDIHRTCRTLSRAGRSDVQSEQRQKRGWT